jgi:N-acetylglucosaminyldiphosphoundecaprenol N-acetyl-beta-D-mannosaminyltransferase
LFNLGKYRFVKARVSESLRVQLPLREEHRKPSVAAVGVASSDHADLDDLSREVFGLLGIPLDAVDLESVLRCIDASVDGRAPFWLSTPNVNFLMMSRSDEAFRESLLMSDCCPVDGMPLVWIARLLGVPIRKRVSGSDIFHALRSRAAPDRRLNVFLFGGAEGVAEKVCHTLNHEVGGLACVGVLNPGFGSTAEMSSAPILQRVSSSGADLLTVFLSARKAQGWLLHNYDRLEVPFRAQFGATINLQAGSVKRAPMWLQKLGFEWLWRIKEEPYLWRRYWNDGVGLLSVIVTCVLPLFGRNLLGRFAGPRGVLTIDRSEDRQSSLIKLSGAATSRDITAAVTCFRGALEANKTIVIDVSKISTIDPRFFGLLLMLRKRAIRQDVALQFVRATPGLRKTFRLNGFEFLLTS